MIEAADGARCRPFSKAECVEFCRAREDAGRGAAEGAGELRPGLLGGSGKFPMTGDEATEGGLGPFLLFFA